MPHPVLQSCLAALSNAGNEEKAWHVLQERRRDLLRHPEIGAELADVLAAVQRAEDVHAELMILEYLVEQARMDAENGGAAGPAFFAAMDGALSRLSENGKLTSPGAFLLGGCFVRAGLQAPPQLQAAGATGAASAQEAAEAPDLPDLDALLDRLREDAEGEAYPLHAVLAEMMATLDAEMRGMLVGQIVERDDPLYGHLGCYWLLHREPDVRRAAAEAFLRRARSGRLDAAIASSLMEVRGWMPGDAARETLDKVLKEALRREVAGGAEPRPWTLHRLLASLPDGAGAQSIAVAAQRSGQRCVAMLLLKQGFGVRDAYVIPCQSATEQKKILAQITGEMDALDVEPAFLDLALPAALGEGAHLDEPPAHGLVDVVEICGVRELRPKTMSVEDWIAEIDPEGELPGMSAQKLGRLVNASAEWSHDYSLMQSWFEDSADLQTILAEAITPRSRETAVWRHLETRRDWWARLIAKAAATIKASTEERREDWKAFAATALALAHGRPLRKVPLMGWIAEVSFEGARDSWNRPEGQSDDGWEEGAECGGSVAFVPPAPERKGELKRLMKKARMDVTPEWIDGYLEAIVVAPKGLMPSDWIGGILEQKHDFPDQMAMQRLLDLVLAHYNAANTDLAESAAVHTRMAARDAAAHRGWAQGFADGVTRHKGAWKAKNVRKDDQRVLKLIEEVAGGRAGAKELEPLLPAWLSRRHAVRG